MRKKYILDYAYAYYSSIDKKMILPFYGVDMQKTKLNYQQYNGGFRFFYGLSLKQFIFDGTIYNYKIGKLTDIKKKTEYRKCIKETAYYKLPKRHNKYLEVQNEKLYEQIQNNLSGLSNNNWIFHISHSYSRYKRYDFIVAEPIVAYQIYGGSFEESVRRKKYKRLNMEKLRKENYELYKECARNINVLKDILLDMMIYNKHVLLKYNDENMRFMEVNN